MKRLMLYCFICLPMAVGVLSWGDGQVLAQYGPVLDKDAAAKMERMKARAERVQQRRNARVSHKERQAAADRAGAAKTITAPGKAGKGVAR